MLACSGRAAAPTPDLVNGIAVIVGDSVITYKDVQLAMEDDLEFLERRYAGQPQVFAEKAAELERDKLEAIIENQLVLQEFNRAGYIVPESLIQSQIDKDMKRYGDRLTLTKTLQAQGITFETYRKRIRERTILELMWQQKVPRDPLVSPAKIEDYYVRNRDNFKLEDQVKLRMILLTNNPQNAAYSPKKLGEELLRKLDDNVSFGELASVYSQDSFAAAGGDRGWLQKTQMRADLAEVAFSLEPGEHRLIETPGGIEIIQVEDKKVSYLQTLSEVRDQIEAALKAEESKRRKQQWIDQLKKKSFVRYF